MKCDLEVLSAHLDGELDDATAKSVEAHLEDCPACAAERGRYEQLQRAFGAEAAQLKFHRDLMERIGRDQIRRKRRRQVRRLAGVAGIPAAVAMVIVAVWLFMGNAEEPVPVVQPEGPVVAREPAVEIVDEPVIEALAEDQAVSLPEIVDIEHTDLPLVLASVDLDAVKPLARIVHSPTGKAMAYAIGQTILPGVLLAEIQEGQVLIDNAGTLEILILAEVEEAPSPGPEGYWKIQFTVIYDDFGEQHSEVRAIISTESDSVNLEFLGNSLLASFSGTLSGYDVIFEGLLSAESGVRYAAEGRFGADFRSLECEGTLTVSGQNLADSEELGMRLSAVWIAENQPPDEARQLALRQAFDERYGELNRAAEKLLGFARTHDGHYPVDLEAASIQAALAFTSNPEITYNAGVAVPNQDLGPWDDYRPNLPLQERLMQLESDLLAIRGQGVSAPVLRVAYPDPKMTFSVDAFGAVHSEEAPPQVPTSEASAAFRSSCGNNMKQLGIIIKMFENEWEGFSPPGWEFVEPDYLLDRRILTCPLEAPGTVSYELLLPATHLDEFVRYVAEETGCCDPQDPRFTGLALSKVPIVIEQHPHEVEGRGVGYNVLFTDGHVEFIVEDVLDARLGPYLALR